MTLPTDYRRRVLQLATRHARRELRAAGWGSNPYDPSALDPIAQRYAAAALERLTDEKLGSVSARVAVRETSILVRLAALEVARDLAKAVRP